MNIKVVFFLLIQFLISKNSMSQEVEALNEVCNSNFLKEELVNKDIKTHEDIGFSTPV
jgi:hypothetical protein